MRVLTPHDYLQSAFPKIICEPKKALSGSMGGYGPPEKGGVSKGRSMYRDRRVVN